MTTHPRVRVGARQARALRTLLLALLVIPSVALALLAAPGGALAQTNNSYHFDRYDADITANTDGSLDVVETLVYVYDSGRFHRGNRAIPLDRTGGITNVSVAEVSASGAPTPYRLTSYDPDNSTFGVPGTYGIVRDGNQLKIRWVYDYVSNTTKTFQVSYHVDGAIRVYSDRDEFDWYAVPQGAGGTINSSRVQLTLPQGVDASKMTTASKPTAESNASGNRIVWSTSGNLDNGLEVGAHIPKGVLNATVPPWQPSVDQQERQQAEYDKNVRPLIDFGALALSIIIAVVGVLWSVRRWYTQGREQPVKLFSDYVTEPPSNLPPGLVGTLLDESADVRDVIATVVDQGRKGNLVIREIDESMLIFHNKDFEYQLLNSRVEYPYEDMVLQAIFKHGNPVRLSALKNTFYSDLQPIYSEMYNEVVRQGLFPESPRAVRSRNIAGGIFVLVFAALLFAAAALFASTMSWMLFALPIALLPMGIIWLVTAGAMPRKTDKGAEEAAKWRAFARYLQEMQRYTNVQAAADKFQQYLPYAVAMGIERDLIRQFQNVPSAMPPYYIPYGYGPMWVPYPVGTGNPQNIGPGSMGGQPGGPAPGFNPAGGMQGMSDSLAGAMQGMSDSFTQMVNSAANILTSSPQPQGGSGGGGGWGGGGGGFGGGGGGGGSAGAD